MTADAPRRIPLAQPDLGDAELANVVAAVRSGWVSSLGPFIPRFEEAFAAFCGARYGVAVTNGTAALHLALVGANVGEGDDVVVPTLTFVATAAAVRYCRARPVFVDSHPAYWGMDTGQLAARITPRTRAIVPVHLYGHPCDMDPIREVARRHAAVVIEDAAEAIGTEYRGRRAGSLGDVGCFSFYGNKVLTTGEGGMCVTDDAALHDRLLLFRDHGMDVTRRYWHDVLGFNYRMTNVQAALGMGQLSRLDGLVAARRDVARWYGEEFGDLAAAGKLTMSPELEWAKSSFWLSSVLLAADGPSVATVSERLAADGIATRPFFHPIHTLPPYRTGERFPVAEDLARRGLSLPSGFGLSRDDVRRVARSLRKALDRRD